MQMTGLILNHLGALGSNSKNKVVWFVTITFEGTDS